ncbi:MAG: alpha-glucan family phosphorylase [Clostridia bacterium]|nr:alpha-glucan family phosphorylase [Clostridia bacterium]
MYIFNRVTVVPQLPKRISKLTEIANNLWWSWNTEFLKLFKKIDNDLWERVEKNPTKFLKLVSQEKIEKIAIDSTFLTEYDKVVEHFESYMNSSDTWFNKNFPNNKDDLIAYFSAEYGFDEILPIYSGGLGILSGDHLKSASDLGLPFVACGLLYKNGYFHQKINIYGEQMSEYHNIDLYNLPILPVKDKMDDDVIIDIELEDKILHLKVWQINVGRIKLYLMDSDIEQNPDDLRNITLRLYGGDKEMRIRQEIVLGMAGVKVLKELGYKPNLYHMNEGHSSFLVIQLIKNIMQEKQVSFEIAKEIVTSQTVFTTHTPVPAGNDIFTINLVEKYFYKFWEKIGISREEFLRLGMKDSEELGQGFNMGILALKIAGKKNGVSKLHGEVSRELFSEVWPNIAEDESPITYVTNGIHTCSWLAPNIKELFNEYLPAYWQDKIHINSTWDKIDSIPNDKLWNAHLVRKEKLMNLIKQNITERCLKNGIGYDHISEVVNGLNPKALTIGFARRFATYKRATLIFKDIVRLTQILNDEKRPVQLVFAGKAHPADKEGQDLIKYINEISQMPQFKGKIFILENYNIGIARYLISGVDVWLNNPRRPMEASGTSGEKASANGVVNFSVLDGWWAEAYNETNGWAIGTNSTYSSYEEQDIADSNSLYHILENKIIPAYYNQDKNGISKEWMTYMKNSIKTTAGEYSTARMVTDYVNKLYMPLINLGNEKFSNLESVIEYTNWKKKVKSSWKEIKISQDRNVDNARMNAGSSIIVNCEVRLPLEISEENTEVQVYFGQILESGTIRNVYTKEMHKIGEKEEERKFYYEAELELNSGGNFGYTFRVLPKHNMLMDPENMDLIKWATNE